MENGSYSMLTFFFYCSITLTVMLLMAISGVPNSILVFLCYFNPLCGFFYMRDRQEFNDLRDVDGWKPFLMWQH